MTAHDQNASDGRIDEADTANFQEFVDRPEATGDDGRTFRMLTLLAGVVVLAVVMYFLLLT